MIAYMDDLMIRPLGDLKNPLIERVCPMCRTFGTNVKFMDLKDDNLKISLTVVTCLTCHAVYSMNCKVDGKDEESIL